MVAPGLTVVSVTPGAGLGGAVAGLVARHALEAVNNWVASGAAWLVGQVGAVLASTGRPQLGPAWFGGHYQAMARLGVLVVVPLLLLSVIQAVARQDLGQLVRAVTVHLPLAILFTAVAVGLVQLGVAAVDAMSTMVSSGSGLDVQRFMHQVAGTIQPSTPVVGGAIPLFVTFLAALVLAFGAFVLWLELIVRAAAIEVAVLFLPLALAGLVWPVTSRSARRLAETLAALVLAKLVVVAVLSLAADALVRGSGPSSGARVIDGTALLVLAAFSPFALLRLVPMLEAGAIGHLEGAGRGMARRATSALHLSPRQLVPALMGAGAAAAGAEGLGPVVAGGTDVAGASGGTGYSGVAWKEAANGWALPPAVLMPWGDGDGDGDGGGEGGAGGDGPPATSSGSRLELTGSSGDDDRP